MSEPHQPHSLVRGWGTGAPLAEPLSAFAPDVCSLRCYYEGTNAPIGNVTGGWVLGRGVTSHLHPQSSKLCTHRHSVLLGLPETYTASRAHEGPLQGPGARQPQDHPSALRQTHSTRGGFHPQDQHLLHDLRPRLLVSTKYCSLRVFNHRDLSS